MDINSFVIGFAKGKKSGTGFFSTKENDAGGLTYAFKATEGGGGGSGGGVELNIAYGDTPPEDTTKLWVKTTQPSKVIVSSVAPASGTIGDSMSYATKIADTYRHCQNCCARVGDYVYSFGGYRFKSQIESVKSNYILKINASSVTKLNNVLSCLQASCAAVGTKIYIIAANNTNTIYCFDTVTETVTTLSVTLPVANRYLHCAAVGTSVYILGGTKAPTAIYCLDTETETITTLNATLKQEVHSGACTALGNKIYIFGGFSGRALDTIQCFDTETYETSILPAKLTTARWGMGCAVAGDSGQIVVYGGISGFGSNGINYRTSYAIDIYDTSTGSIRTYASNANTPQWTACATHPSNANTIIVVGGCSSSSSATTSTPTSLLERAWTFTVGADFELEEGTLYIRTNVTTANKNWSAIVGEDMSVTVTPHTIHKGLAGNVGKQVSGALYYDGDWSMKF